MRVGLRARVRERARVRIRVRARVGVRVGAKVRVKGQAVPNSNQVNVGAGCGVTAYECGARSLVAAVAATARMLASPYRSGSGRMGFIANRIGPIQE